MALLAAVIVVATLVAMTSGKVPAVLALGTGLAAAGLTGITPPEELFAGLSNGGVITIAGMLVIAEGIVQTGVVSRVTWALLATVTTAGQALRRLMVPVAVGSGLINTTPIVAMLIPAAKELEQTRQIPAREVLLPIAHVTTLAGGITLIGTSSNLIIAGIAEPAGVAMSMLTFAPVALPVTIVGALVIAITAPRMLRRSTPTEDVPMDWRAEIPVSSRALIVGRVPADAGLVPTAQYELQHIDRDGDRHPPDATVEAGDVLVFRSTHEGVPALWGSPLFGLEPHRLYEVSVSSGESGTMRDFEEDGEFEVIAAMTDRPLRKSPVVPGETCFVTGPHAQILQETPGIALWQRAAGRAPQPGKTWIAVAILVGVIVAASFGLAPVSLAAFTGALLMVIVGVLKPSSAVRALDWKTLFIIAGSIGLGAVVVTSGLADYIVSAIEYLSAGNVLLVVIVFTITTALLTNLVTNAAAASILTPVALTIAPQVSIDPRLLLALIGTCICFTFINPFSHQSNLMVMKPGGYSTAVFAKYGTPLIVAVVLAAIGSTYLLVTL